MRPLPLILAPSLPFTELVRRLGALGWRRAPGIPATVPLVAEEPEVAVFRSADGLSRLGYTWNPAVGLRVLAPDGADDRAFQEIRALSLPQLEDGAIASLLQDDRPRNVVLGIFAATERRLTSVLPVLTDLTRHAEPIVAKAARRARRTLEVEPAMPVEDRFADGVGERRQTLRRTGQQGGITVASLRQALADPDLEMRAGAVLLAARNGLATLLPDIAGADLASRLPGHDRRLLEAMRRAVIASLQGYRPPAEDGSTAPAMKDHLWRCALGLPVSRLDDVLLIATALTTPLDLPPIPRGSPLGSPTGGAFQLSPLKTRFRWIGPTLHWLGHDEATAIANPVRQWSPPAAALIAEHPLTSDDLAALDPSHCPPSDEAHAFTTAEVARVLARLTDAAGVPVTLPGADLLEAGLRGPDGRRYPWGALPSSTRVSAAASPWGLAWAGPPGEWTADRTPDGRPVIGGTDRKGRPSLRIAGSDAADARYLLRPVIAIVGR